MDDLITWFYSGGDLMMCNVKLIVAFMCLQFCLTCVSIIRDGIKAVG